MSEYSDLIGSSYGRANPALPPTVGNIDEDPDRAAQAVDLAKATGVPSTAIFGDFDEFQRQHKAVLASDIVANNPHLSDWVARDPMHPKIANDDYGNLDAVSQKVSALDLPMRALRAPERLANLLFPGDPLKHFTEGGRLGSWLRSEDVKNYPVSSAIAAGLGTPIELLFRGIGGVIETGAEAGANLAGAVDPALGRDVGAVIQSEGMGLTGRHGIHVPDSPAARVRPYLENGREPPPGVLPEYDTYRTKQNAEDLGALKEATSDAQSSMLRERNPEMFRDFIAQHTDAEIGIGGEAAVALYGDKVPHPEDNLLGWVPGIESKLELARAIGDDISVPLADWLARAEPETMQALHDDIRVRPGGITTNEAKVTAEMEKERVRFAAIDVDGTTYKGATHADAVAKFTSETGKPLEYLNDQNTTEGFLTSNGRYIDRKEAAKLAEENEQLKEGRTPQFKGNAGELDAVDLDDKKRIGGKQPPPIPEEVPITRHGAALEPMFSVGDRGLKIERRPPNMKNDIIGADEFRLLDQDGNKVGHLEITPHDSGKKLYVDNVLGLGGLGPRDFGPALMRDLLRQIKSEYPEAEQIGGFRISGARERAGSEAETWIKLDKLDSLDYNAFKEILEGGKWETYSPSIQGYVKPDFARSEQHQDLANAVRDELDRLVPQKVGIEVPDTLKVTGKVEGQREGEKIRIGGVYIRYRDTYPIILAALDADNTLLTARHEAIHHLRSYGFFKPEEWATLEAQALAGGWFKKYRIDERYPNAKPDLKLEEAIAEAYPHWVEQQRNLTERAKSLLGIESPLDAIFRRMHEFFTRVRERIGAILGTNNPTWEDVFQKVDTGEVGAREGTQPLDPRAFNEKLSISDTDISQPPETGKIRYYHGTAFSDAAQFSGSTFLSPEYKYAKAYAERSGEKANILHTDFTKEEALRRGLYDEVNDYPINGPIDDGKALLKPLMPPNTGLREDPGGGSRVFERAAALGMTVDQFKRYDELIQKRHAEDITAATKRATDQKARELTKTWREDRKALRQDVSDEIRQRPDVAADLFFGAGELYGKKVPLGSVKMDASALTAEQKSALPRQFYGEHGLHPDDVANLFGYGSGDQMVGKLVEYNQAKLAAGMSSKDFVSRVTDIETDRQMRLKHGVLEDNIMDAVKEQVAGQTQLDILAEETHALGMKAGQAPLDKAAITSQLKESFSKMPLGSVSSDAYLRAAGKAGRQAELALLGDDPAAAFRAKQQQWYATVIAKEAVALEKDLDRFDKVAKRFSKRDVPSIDPAYTNFIHDILQRVGKQVRRSVQDIATEIEAGEYKSLAEFVDGKNGFYLREVAVADILLDPAFRKKFEDLTVDEFNAVNTSIKSMVANGRNELKITKAGVEADLKDIRGQMINQLAKFQERTYDAKGGRWMGPIPPKIAKVLRSYGTAHIQMENLFNRWDHDNPQGVFQQYIMRDLVDAANNESVMEKRYATRLRDIDDKADLKKQVDNPIFKVPNSDQLMKFNRGNLRTILLNAGNKSNLDKMARGYKLAPEQVLQWIDRHATKEDWDWAQKMGDIFAEVKQEADLMYRNLSGVAPASIPIEPITTPHGQYPGWYYPVMYHPEFEGPSKKLMGKDALEQEGFVRATTSNGYTQARTGYAGPMALDLDMLPARMKQMIHDIAMRPSVINASKIFYDKDVRGAVSKHFGNEWRDMLVPYLVDVSNSANYLPKDQRMFMQASEFVRQNMISTLVGLNPGTVLKHGPTALVQSLHEVGAVPFLKAIKGLFSINERTGETNWQFAMKESEELQRRHQNSVETLGGATDMLQPRGGFASLRSTVQRFSAQPVAISDLLSAVPTWLAQYKKAMDANGGVHGDAVYDANRAVRRAHGSMAITNRSSVMRGGALSQWFASVYGFFNHIMNRQYELVWKSGEALGLAKEGNYKEAMQRAPELTSMLFAYVVAPALIEEAVTPLMSDDKESWGKKAAKGLAFTLGASWVGVRDIVNAMLNNRDPSAGLLSTAGKTVVDPFRDLAKKAPFSREHAGKIVRDGATMLGALTGVVPAQVGKVAQFGYGVQQGTERPKGPWGWMTGMRFGTLKNHPATFADWQKHHLGGH